jgi:hypothetical protein
MSFERRSWYDEQAGPLVRPYAVTRGRTVGTGRELDMLTVVAKAEFAPRLRRTEPEYRQIVRLCRTPISVAELSASLRLPLAVTKILVGDLIGEGQLNFRSPVQSDGGVGDLNLLRAVLDGIRRI